MNILVFIKQVPQITNVKINPETGNLDREGIKGVINPADKNAIELALELKETKGANVCVLSMGPSQAEDSLILALAMGCDKAVLISDRAFVGSDTLATGEVLSKACKKIGNYDLILFGSRAIDADTGQTGPIVAEKLGLGQASFVKDVEFENDNIICQRDFLNGKTQKLKLKMPAVLTIDENLNTPRYPSPRGILLAMNKDIERWTKDDLIIDDDRVGIKGSPSVVESIFEPKSGKKQSQMLEGSTGDIAKKIVDILEENHILS